MLGILVLVMSNQTTSPAYVGLEECRKLVFGTGPEAPSKRCFLEWKARGFYPFIKVGKRVFANADEVKAALERRFKVNAVEPR